MATFLKRLKEEISRKWYLRVMLIIMYVVWLMGVAGIGALIWNATFAQTDDYGPVTWNLLVANWWAPFLLVGLVFFICAVAYLVAIAFAFIFMFLVSTLEYIRDEEWNHSSYCNTAFDLMDKWFCQLCLMLAIGPLIINRLTVSEAEADQT